MKSIKFSEKILIAKPQLAVFDYTQNYQKRLEWDTFLIKAYLLEDAQEAEMGVKAYCVAYNGLGMETEYVSFQRPHVTAIKMTKGPIMFSSFLGSWNFKKITEHKTQVIFLYAYQLRFPFSLLSYVIKHLLRKNVKHRLQDLKRKLEQSSELPLVDRGRPSFWTL